MSVAAGRDSTTRHRVFHAPVFRQLRAEQLDAILYFRHIWPVQIVAELVWFAWRRPPTHVNPHIWPET